MGENEYAFFMHSNGFLAVIITEISFLMVFTKPCHLKIMQRCDVVHDV